ncbi:unnamed protein product, partial [Effrenium voratum]
ALTKARATFEAKRKELESSAATSGTLSGRTNFAKCLAPNDPAILKCFKGLAALRPMQVLTKASSDGTGISLTQAVIIRKGRNTFMQVTKDYKDDMESSLNQFRDNLANKSEGRSAFRWLPSSIVVSFWVRV